MLVVWADLLFANVNYLFLIVVVVVIMIITCGLVLDIRAHMHTGSDETHGPHIRTALPS